VHQTNPSLQISHGSSGVLYQEEGWLAPAGSRLSGTQFCDSQEQIPPPTNLQTRVPTPWS